MFMSLCIQLVCCLLFQQASLLQTAVQDFAQSLQQLGSVISKYGSQRSKVLPTTMYFSTAPSHRNGRQRCIHSLYSNIFKVSSHVARILQNPVHVSSSIFFFTRQPLPTSYTPPIFANLAINATRQSPEAIG